METSITQVSPVEYDLEINVPADQLEPKIDTAVRAQRGKVTLKGFRPGNVPLSLVKKMYGKAIALDVVEKLVQDLFEEEVTHSGKYDVVGRPQINEFEYEPFEDLRVVLRFNVRPEFELADVSGESVTQFTHEIKEDEVEAEIERMRYKEGELVTHEEEVGEQDVVIVDVQRVDEATGAPIIGERDEDVSIFMNDPNLRPEFKEAFLGRKVGEDVSVDLPADEDEEEAAGESLIEIPVQPGRGKGEPQRMRASIKEVRRWNLPEIDDEFASRISEEQFESVEELRAGIEAELSRSWERRSQDILEGKIIDRMVAMHDFAVPPALVDVQLDYMLNEFKKENKNEMPADFDEEAYREKNRETAEKLAKWMLVFEKLVETEDIQVDDEDLANVLQPLMGQEIEPAQAKQFLQKANMLDATRQRVLTQKVMGLLTSRFQIVQKSLDDLEKEQESAAEEKETAEQEEKA